jgi:hypothetical protein
MRLQQQRHGVFYFVRAIHSGSDRVSFYVRVNQDGDDMGAGSSRDNHDAF